MAKEDIPELQSIWDEAKGYIEHGDFDKAIEIYKYILIRYVDNAVAVKYANAYLGDVYLTLKQPDTAQIHIQKAIDADSEEPSFRSRWVSHIHLNVSGGWQLKNLKLLLRKSPTTVNIFVG